MKFSNSNDVRDFGGCITRYGDYATAEPFISNKEYDIRVQKIGKHYRAYKRVSTCGNWKSNQGSSLLTEVNLSFSFVNL